MVRIAVCCTFLTSFTIFSNRSHPWWLFPSMLAVTLNLRANLRYDELSDCVLLLPSSISATSIVYNFTYLDQLLDWLHVNGLRPGFELMGNPSDYYTSFENKTQVYQWKDFITQVKNIPKFTCVAYSTVVLVPPCE